MSSDDTIKELRAHIKELEDRLDLTLDVIVEHMHQHTERLSNIETVSYTHLTLPTIYSV